MIFLSPMAVYLLGLAGVIIALYFLKRKVPLRPVSALFLWQRFVERPKSALRFLRSSLFLLLLQLLALALLVWALANPVFYIQTPGPKRIALIVDGSLSMQTKTVSKFTSSQVHKSQVMRYDEAIAKALELINANPAAQITVIQAQAQSVILSQLSHKRSEAISALRRSRPTFQGDANFKELLELLKSQAPLDSFDKIVFLTDHTPEDGFGLLKDLKMELVLVGSSARNVGITAFAVRHQPKQFASLQGAPEYSLLVTLENFSSERVSITLRVSADEEIISEADIVIEAETRKSYEFSYSGPARLFKAEITLEDDLEADNVRYFALPNPPKVRSLWLGEENTFLKSALSVLGEFIFEQGENKEPAEHDLVVANNARFTQRVEGNLLLINSELPDVVRLIDDENILKEWSVKAADHILLEGLEAGELFAAPFRGAKVSERGQIVVTTKTDAAEYPLLYLYEDEELRLVWLGLDLRYANVVLSLDFPILIRNIIAWLLPWLLADPNLGIGEGIPLSGLPPLKIIEPNGRISQPPSQRAFLDTNLPGFYKIITKDQVLAYAVNPHAAESDIRPRGQPQVPSQKVESPTSYDLQLSDFRLFRLFVLGGLILLLLELYFYAPSLWRLKGVR